MPGRRLLARWIIAPLGPCGSIGFIQLAQAALRLGQRRGRPCLRLSRSAHGAKLGLELGSPLKKLGDAIALLGRAEAGNIRVQFFSSVGREGCAGAWRDEKVNYLATLPFGPTFHMDKGDGAKMRRDNDSNMRATCNMQDMIRHCNIWDKIEGEKSMRIGYPLVRERGWNAA